MDSQTHYHQAFPKLAIKYVQIMSMLYRVSSVIHLLFRGLYVPKQQFALQVADQ